MYLQSPNSTPDNSNATNKSLEILPRCFSSNFFILRDFNYAKIDWEYSKTSSLSNLNYEFLKCTRDFF